MNDGLNQNNENDVQVLGELRKENIGRPKLVLFILFILIAVLVCLPIVNDMLNDETSFLYNLIYPNTSNNNIPVDYEDEILDGSELQLLSEKTTMKYNSLIIKSMSIHENNLLLSMSSINGILDLDDYMWVLEVYANDQLVTYYKLSGSLDFEETKYEFSNNVTYNAMKTYYVKVVDKKEEELPEVAVTSDESGISSLTCKKENQTVEYSFLNGELINIKDERDFIKAQYGDEEYTTLLQDYKTKAGKIGVMASAFETEIGFKYQANIDLENMNVEDKDYYAYKTSIKKINYIEIGKGFDCK